MLGGLFSCRLSRVAYSQELHGIIDEVTGCAPFATP